ncbi:MAG: hypothetical protein JWP97_104 [Labilithrix sp.]|nr:hypothetical protein [Labilithrix sp.]
MSILSPRQQSVAFLAVLLVLSIAGAITFVPLWAPLVLAAWVAVLCRPLLLRFSKITHGRDRAAAGLTALLVTLILLPVGLALLSLVRGAADLGRGLLQSNGLKSGLVSVVSGDKGGETDLASLVSPQKAIALLQEYGSQAAGVLSNIAGAAAQAALALFIFVYAVYVFLVDGPGYYRWLERHSPLDVRHTRRLVAAFNETGRGLFVSVGLTGLAQGIIATITYFALGVPRALVLGLLTCVASLIPSVGTALVWVPIAIGLALAGKTVPAIVMAAVGVLVIGMIDNVLRPVFARIGELKLSTFVLLTAIFGGLAFFGTWGLLLGPLFARLAKEALVLAREDRGETEEPEGEEDQRDSDISEASSPSA